ncbi:MAG: galactose mutarotase [Oscillospiraceae bacterium]|nr:galactose mutarotase [Oscillospiraceae bacterium]
MSVSKDLIGTTKDGEEVYIIKLDNGKGLSAEVLNYGGIIKNLYFTAADGKKIDVVLGRDSLEEYLDNYGFYGAAIGRYANRIENSEFEIGGKIYKVGANEGRNSLHGGIFGFDKKVWEAYEGESGGEPGVEMILESPDMEEGFPGTLKVKMTYTLTKENSLKIEYRAMSDKDTAVNLTNHSYFNLSGHSSGNIYNQVLQINSGFYTPNNKECMPFGEILTVDGTPFDFREPKPIGRDISADFEQINMFGGYDHNFVIDGRGYRLAATAFSPDTGITMKMYTDKPAVQLYTTNGTENGRVCKDGTVYEKHQAFCLETQYFPNSMKYSHYPSPILKAGEEYRFTTEYEFSAK